jgi:transcription initiation factor TFIIIB Brf1 subunit/transcription initiation factor TFIIB
MPRRMPGPPFRTCPSCGYTWSGFQSNCPKCGYSMSRRSYEGGGSVCCTCGESHGNLPSVINKWHRCRSCGSVYCPNCGYELEKPDFFSGERICNKCGGRTYLW